MIGTSEILEHYQDSWGSVPEQCRFDKGPIRELPADFRVVVCPPQGSRTIWSFGTCGMSQPGDPDRIELHVLSNSPSKEVVELLYMAAHFHRRSEPLGLWHTIRFGKPWIAGSECRNGLVSLPYIDGPKLETLELGDEAVKCYWLLPITDQELKLKLERGVKALEDAFEDSGFDYADSNRRSVV